MIAPAELAARHTDLSGEAFVYIQRMMGSWGALSDLSFSDLLLLAPLRRPNGGQWVVLGQIRPTTGATLLRVDLVGHLVEEQEWEGISEALRTGAISVGTISLSDVLPPPVGPVATIAAPGPSAPAARTEVPAPQSDSPPTGEVPAIGEHAQLECLPVRCQGAVVAVVARVGPLVERRKGRLERVYRDVYHRLAAMVAAGEFPNVSEEAITEDAPRVGDGLLVTDAEGRITYASPNAMSALHRMGVSEVVEGHRLSELGVEEAAVDAALATGRPVIEEVERRPDVIVLVHCIPLVVAASATGAMVLLRDVTDLRRLDRLLLSKDAAIREVHHRVKNNLQTISSLLRLQARRLDEGKGREALREAERRVRSIAVVHEILSRDPGDQVPFGEIVQALVRMAEDSVVSGRKVRITVSGAVGDLPADVATPLALALAELLQNAVGHAFSDGAKDHHEASGDHHEVPGVAAGGGGHVCVSLSSSRDELTLEVRDDGRGLPEGFDLDHTTSLGLSIVRDLVRSQLGGAMSMQNADGTLVRIAIPLARDGRQVEVGRI
ncbi:MAG TPA: histidine kinase N-terminal domain-containing protein [Acidimicrobiales bacterium]|nr:histidine kinase N-terminal domain-containing protein [Acidimicrobiales bacterium]